MNDEAEDDDPLIFRYGAGSGEPPFVPVRLDVVGSVQIVLAHVRPELPVSSIAAQWANALDLSHGAAVLAQLVTRNDEQAEGWGPCEMLTPAVDDELDAAITFEGLGGFLLGRDFLRFVWVTFIGPAGLIAFTHRADD